MPIITHWASPPIDLFSKLTPGVVHIWRTPLDDSSKRASRFRPLLSADERVRADRCRIPHPQYQFIITRGILRILLSRYVHAPSSQIQLQSLPQGKPLLMIPSSSPIQFNVSHTRGMALIALTMEHSVGIGRGMDRSKNTGTRDC